MTKCAARPGWQMTLHDSNTCTDKSYNKSELTDPRYQKCSKQGRRSCRQRPMRCPGRPLTSTCSETGRLPWRSARSRRGTRKWPQTRRSQPSRKTTIWARRRQRGELAGPLGSPWWDPPSGPMSQCAASQRTCSLQSSHPPLSTPWLFTCQRPRLSFPSRLQLRYGWRREFGWGIL